jgi:hypothetical protein
LSTTESGPDQAATAARHLSPTPRHPKSMRRRRMPTFS